MTTRTDYIQEIRNFIDFINRQVGIYCAARDGFSKSKVIIERQVARINFASGVKINERGERIVMRSSVEDPTRPAVIHHRILLADDFIAENSENGANEQQLIEYIVVFIYTFWEVEMRSRLAKAKGKELNEVTSDIMGDLRLVRHAILHKKSVMVCEDFSKLKHLQNMLKANKKIIISNDNMHKIFILIKQDMARMLFEVTGVPPDTKPDEIISIAIQTK